MPRRRWSFFMPAEEHEFIRFLTDRYQALLTPLGQGLFWGAVAASLMMIWGLLPAVACFAFCSGALLAGSLSGWVSRPRLKLDRRAQPPPVFAGESVQVRLGVENLGPRQARKVIIEGRALPIGILPLGESPFIESLGPGERAEVGLTLGCRARGVYALSWIQASSFFPSALVKWPQANREKTWITVYPRMSPVAPFEVPLSRASPGGTLALRPGEPMELAGTREWREGDRTRDIDWAGFARTGHLAVKEYREERVAHLAMIIEVESRSVSDDALLERNLSLAAGAAAALVREGFSIDPLVVGSKTFQFDAGRSPLSLESILDVLAGVVPERRLDLAAAERVLLADPDRCSAVIWVMKHWDARRAELVRKLRDSGMAVRILSAGLQARPAELSPREWVDPE